MTETALYDTPCAQCGDTIREGDPVWVEDTSFDEERAWSAVAVYCELCSKGEVYVDHSWGAMQASSLNP